MKKLISFLIFFLIIANKVYAYSSFISHGYTSCLTCHYNALGNGPLNDYGRGVSATAISSRSFYSKDKDDQYLSDHSSFFFGAMKEQKVIRPSIDARFLRYTRNFTKGGSVSRNIFMQAEANIVIKPLENDKFYFSGSYGYAPTPINANKNSSSTQQNVISREHYFMYNPIKNHRFYFGFMDKGYGLRIPDHIAFSRVVTGNAQNDQSHGITYHYYNSKYELASSLFLGNLNQESDLRQKGLSLTGEYELNNKARIGGSVLSSQNKYLKNIMNSIHLRLGFGEGASLISELGQVTKIPIDSDIAKTTGVYNFSQATMQVARGYNLLTTFEYYKSDISSSSANSNYKYGIGLLCFPIQRIELRFDIVNSRIISTSTVVSDTIDLMSQVHLWF